MTFHPKTHAHVMLTQVNAKQGLIKYGEKANEAILKELRQLHSTQALLPMKKDDMAHNKSKKALKYLKGIKRWNNQGTRMHRRSATKVIYNKGRGKLPNSVTGGPNALMCNKHKRKQTSSCDRHSGSRLTCRHGRHSAHDTDCQT